MRLLLITQKVDRNDHYLSFFHRWIIEFSKHFESIVVICLEEGEHGLPSNVRVLSLGKEERQSRLQYLIHFYWYIFHERKNYDAVLSHMNQEYINLGGVIWRLMGKRVSMWRNHHAGSFLTRTAGWLAHKVFCTSKYSYTATFPNIVFMPLGIDTSLHTPDAVEKRIPHSILFFARINKVKRPHILIDAVGQLRDQGVKSTVAIFGDALPKDAEYAEGLREKVKSMNLSDSISFHPGMPNDKTPEVFRDYQIFVNLSPSGMYDKMIFEAASCHALALSSNENLRGQIDERLVFKEGSLDDLVSKLRILLTSAPEEVQALQKEFREYVIQKHSLQFLGKRIEEEIHAIK